jgi:hypothetical protein
MPRNDNFLDRVTQQIDDRIAQIDRTIDRMMSEQERAMNRLFSDYDRALDRHLSALPLPPPAPRGPRAPVPPRAPTPPTAPAPSPVATVAKEEPPVPARSLWELLEEEDDEGVAPVTGPKPAPAPRGFWAWLKDAL